MKGFGIFLFALGAIAFLGGFSMDTSVSSGFGGRVHNIGLLNDRQNIIVFAGVMVVIGAIFVGFASKNEQTVDRSSSTRTCPFCAEKIKAEAIICRFCQKELPPIAQPEQTVASKPNQGSNDFESLYEEVSGNLAKHAPFLLGILAFIIFVTVSYFKQ